MRARVTIDSALVTQTTECLDQNVAAEALPVATLPRTLQQSARAWVRVHGCACMGAYAWVRVHRYACMGARAWVRAGLD